MRLGRSAGVVRVGLDQGPRENFCRPAADPLLRSAAEVYGNAVLCLVLTGMGSDGLEGARTIVEKGGHVVVQDEATSVVWGMPGAVATAGLAHEVLPRSHSLVPYPDPDTDDPVRTVVVTSASVCWEVLLARPRL